MIESVLSSLFTLENLLWINVGLAGGIMVGALPGLTGTMAMALLLPLIHTAWRPSRGLCCCWASTAAVSTAVPSPPS